MKDRSVRLEICRECRALHSGELCPKCGSIETIDFDADPKPPATPDRRHAAGGACVPCVRRRADVRATAAEGCGHEIFEDACPACRAQFEILEGRA